jgi:hypothetical protein
VEQPILVHQLHPLHGVSVTWQRDGKHVVLRTGVRGTWPAAGRSALGGHTQTAQDLVQHAAPPNSTAPAARSPHHAQL